jgi:hypothetical protein
MKIKWLDKPEKHDYKAADSYLGLTREWKNLSRMT